MKIYFRGERIHYIQRKGNQYTFHTGIVEEAVIQKAHKLLYYRVKPEIINQTDGPIVKHHVVYPSEINKKLVKHKRRSL